MSGHSTELALHLTQWAPFAALLASLAGSMHCAAMCGPIALGIGRNPRENLAYQTGRLVSYAALGALSGAVGHAVLSENAPIWLSLLAATGIGLTLLFQGLKAWPGLNLSSRLARIPSPNWGGKLLFRALNRRATGGEALPLAFQAGIGTALLPCGWLYSFVATAAATQSTGGGALLMTAFWVGTLPALSLGTWIVSRWIAPVARRVPRLTASLLILAGLLTVGSKLHAATDGFRHAPHQKHCCHDAN